MEDFFGGYEQPAGQDGAVPAQADYPEHNEEEEFGRPNSSEPAELPTNSGLNYQQFDYQPAQTPPPTYNDNDNEFDDFEEDEVTRKIREEEQRVQNALREKSEKEWEVKQQRSADGRRQLEEFRERKQNQKRQRAEDNLQKEKEIRQEQGKLNQEAGWRKVVSNINLKQGERKGPKDINRMREAILHKRQDQK